jgi:hypothetical protein
MTDLIFQANPWLLPIVMLVVLGCAIEFPYRLGAGAFGDLGKHVDAFNATQAGLLTLASFVLGLSFAQASARFDGRRELVVKEANAIGTTWLRADQLAPAQRVAFRRVLTAYATARLRAYESAGKAPFYQREIDDSVGDQSTLWAMVAPALHANPTNLGLSLLMQTLNDTIDISTDQFQQFNTHVPTAVVLLTLVLVALGALSLGVRFAIDRARPAILSAVYVIASVVVISMMIDYDRPRTGFIVVNLDPLKIQVESMRRP